MRNKLLVTTIILLSSNVFAQIKAVTEKGDTILVFDDNTWKPIKDTDQDIEFIGNVKAIVTVDELEGTKSIYTDSWYNFGSNELEKSISGSIRSVDGLITINLTYYGDLCLVQGGSMASIKLTNGDIIKCIFIDETNCNGSSTGGYFAPLDHDQVNATNYKSIMEDNINLLAKYDWELIRIQGKEYYTDIHPKVSDKIDHPEQFFRQHISAILKNQ